MSTIRVLLADDQVLFVQSLKNVLETRAQDIQVVGVAYNGREAVALSEELEPDVVLMDVRMPEMDGVEAARIILSKRAHIHIVMLTTFDDDDYVFEVMKDGAEGYLLKNMAPQELISSIRAVNDGSVQMSSDVANKLVRFGFGRHTASDAPEPDVSSAEQALAALSKREREIAELIADGYDNYSIAAQLNIAEQTVKNHVSIIYSKLQLHDRIQLIKMFEALRHRRGAS